MDPQLKQLAQELRSRYLDRLQQVLFFGSHARGEASPESDYDCLLIFDRVTPELKEDLQHLCAQWLLHRGLVFSWIALSESDLERLRYEPFLQMLDAKGSLRDRSRSAAFAA